jgi:hypothetical protein
MEAAGIAEEKIQNPHTQKRRMRHPKFVLWRGLWPTRQNIRNPSVLEFCPPSSTLEVFLFATSLNSVRPARVPESD